LLEKGIPNAIYYPVALHSQKAYSVWLFYECTIVFPLNNNAILYFSLQNLK
jgi:hypothetical protein